MILLSSSVTLVAQCFSLATAAVPGRGMELPAQEILFARDGVTNTLSATLVDTAAQQSLLFPDLAGLLTFSPAPNEPFIAVEGTSAAGESGQGSVLRVEAGFQMWVGGVYGTVTLGQGDATETIRVLCRPL